MKVVTLHGTYEISLERMKVRRSDGSEVDLEAVPSPVVGERMMLNGESTAPVERIER